MEIKKIVISLIILIFSSQIGALTKQEAQKILQDNYTDLKIETEQKYKKLMEDFEKEKEAAKRRYEEEGGIGDMPEIEPPVAIELPSLNFNDLDSLKKIYRKLSIRWHPDKNKGNAGAEQKFKDINDAYGFFEKNLNSAAGINQEEKKQEQNKRLIEQLYRKAVRIFVLENRKSASNRDYSDPLYAFQDIIKYPNIAEIAPEQEIAAYDYLSQIYFKGDKKIKPDLILARQYAKAALDKGLESAQNILDEIDKKEELEKKEKEEKKQEDPVLNEFKIGERLYREGEFKKAIEQLSTIVNQVHNNDLRLKAAFMLADIYFDKKDLERAEFYSKIALEDKHLSQQKKELLEKIINQKEAIARQKAEEERIRQEAQKEEQAKEKAAISLMKNLNFPPNRNLKLLVQRGQPLHYTYEGFIQKYNNELRDNPNFASKLLAVLNEIAYTKEGYANEYAYIREYLENKGFSQKQIAAKLR